MKVEFLFLKKIVYFGCHLAFEIVFFLLLFLVFPGIKNE